MSITSGGCSTMRSAFAMVAGEFPVGDQDLRLAVLEHERDGFRVQAGIEGIQHGAGHRHAEMGFEHGRDVGRHDRHGVARPDAALRQRRRQSAAPAVGLAPK